MSRKGNKLEKSMDIPLNVILSQIRDCFKMAEQWKKYEEIEWSQNVTEYITKADCLIELLEAYLFGSVGGFGPGQIDRSLKGRFDYLVVYINVPNVFKKGV